MTIAAQHVHWYGWVGLGLLLLGLLVVLYWVFRLLGFIVRAPFRAIGHASGRTQQEAAKPGLGSQYEQLVLANSEVDRERSSLRFRSSGHIVHRSKVEAAALTFVILMVSAGVIDGVAEIVRVAAGSTAEGLAALGAEIVVLSFLTYRAYPPGAKRPILRLLLLLIVTLGIGPLIYLGWLWMTGKKWPVPTTEAVEPAS